MPYIYTTRPQVEVLVAMLVPRNSVNFSINNYMIILCVIMCIITHVVHCVCTFNLSFTELQHTDLQCSYKNTFQKEETITPTFQTKMWGKTPKILGKPPKTSPFFRKSKNLRKSGCILHPNHIIVF